MKLDRPVAKNKNKKYCKGNEQYEGVDLLMSFPVLNCFKNNDNIWIDYECDSYYNRPKEI